MSKVSPKQRVAQLQEWLSSRSKPSKKAKPESMPSRSEYYKQKNVQ